MTGQTPTPADEAQSKRFIDTAKELGADGDAEAFGRLLGQIAPVKKPDERDDQAGAKDAL